jgi:isoleucyl-tRNA synthetase
MPFAQWGYPHKAGSLEKFKASYPADFICEAIDQTRGWFYTLMTIGTLVFDKSSYKTVLCLGHILDKDGRKMSKHLGNVLEPMPLMDQHGADAVRWYMLAAGSPWSARRVGHDAITDVVRKTLLTYWNTVSFFTLYAKASDFKLTGLSEDSSTMDRWIISELNDLIAKVDQAYENFDSQTAGSIIGQFIDDLSNWYVRRSRRKFWDGESAALNTLYFCLKELTKLMAPMVPFITEHVWQEMIRKLEPSEFESVHLANFPVSDASKIDEQLSKSVRLSRRLVELGRAARAESKVKIRQPLARALVAANGWDEMDQEIRSHVSDELNVQNLDEIASAGADLVSISVKANFRTIGAKFGGDVQTIAKAISAQDHTLLVSQIRSTGSFDIDFGGAQSARIDLEDLVITETPKAGWSVASHNGESVALDLALTPALIEAGLVREVIRAIQEERKQSGFEISDRISVRWSANPQVSAAILKNQKDIGEETLATNFENVPEKNETANELGLWLELTKNS